MLLTCWNVVDLLKCCWHVDMSTYWAGHVTWAWLHLDKNCAGTHTYVFCIPDLRAQLSDMLTVNLLTFYHIFMPSSWHVYCCPPQGHLADCPARQARHPRAGEHVQGVCWLSGQMSWGVFWLLFDRSIILQVNVDARWTAEQLKDHPFLQMSAPKSEIPPLIQKTKEQKGKK